MQRLLHRFIFVLMGKQRVASGEWRLLAALFSSLSVRQAWCLFCVVGGMLVFGQPHSVFAAPALQTNDPVIAAAGDISKCNRQEDTYTAYLLDSIDGPILSIGDNAYDSGTLQEFNECYAPTWGRHKDRIYPVPGNHEYYTGGATGYYTYFGDAASPLEPGCTKECKGYYSFDVGTWHVVALNSEIATEAGSEQEQWLRADLAAHPSVCTLAYWHRPRFSSGRHLSGGAQGLYQALYDFGADVVLSGHDHDYERFAPQDPSGQYAPDRGIRQFVVGTGGDGLRDVKFIQPNSEVRNNETWGVIKLTLHPDSYDWEFVPIPGQTFTDVGSAPCVTAPNVPTAPAAAAADTAPILVSTAAPAPAAATLPAAGIDYTIQAGDTLGIIAARYGLDWSTLADANQLGAYSILEIGQVIRVPGVQSTSSAPAASAASSAVQPVAATTSSAGVVAAAPATQPSAGRYTVQPGDTLFGIALSYDLTWQALAAANGMSESDFLQIGQELTIPGQAAAAAVAATASPRAGSHLDRQRHDGGIEDRPGPDSHLDRQRHDGGVEDRPGPDSHLDRQRHDDGTEGRHGACGEYGRRARRPRSHRGQRRHHHQHRAGQQPGLAGTYAVEWAHRRVVLTDRAADSS